MRNRIVHIVYAFFLGLLLLFGTTPKEFVHLFADHHDTVHSKHYGKEGATVEQEHHHCSYIDFALTPFSNDLQLPFIGFAGSADYLTYAVTVAERTLVQPIRLSCPRGPPSIA